MFASRLVRAQKFVVGMGIKDLTGSQAAIKKTINFAQPGDHITALHIPRMVPEMMLSSMADPGEASEDTIDMLAGMPAKTALKLQSVIEETAKEEMQRLGKEIPMEFQVSSPVANLKPAILEACKAEKADFLVLGAGVGGNGSMPLYAISQAKGLTVCVVSEAE
uniref:UspA domain-containing protein n=1 Tax=Noctiluca scintillans TaxID=2966 RepID=A0A7S0ZM32_NOCSC|mmetsp:Transcript_10571/g.29305  ORF Transcript_10571/g.29305 Transcript_10571/m.29305 type:complete len:164 (+) Transcript_10571:63-554(+)